MSLRLYLVDDEAPARARLAMLLADIAATCPNLVVGEAGTAAAALEGIAATRPDVVLLDVQMPGMSGIELAEHLAQAGAGAPTVIFITAFDEYALKAFEVRAIDYLMKPVRASRLEAALQRAGELRAQRPAAETAQGERQYFSIQERDRVFRVPLGEVIYLKAEQKYVTVRTRERQYLIEESLVALEQELKASFVRVHRNALVARHAIAAVERGTQAVDAEADGDKAAEPWQVVLRGVDERLPISRRMWPVVKALVK